MEKENFDVEENDDEQSEDYTLPYVYKLLEPKTIGATHYTEIVLKQTPTGKSVRSLPVGDLKNIPLHSLYPMIAEMAGLPRVVIESLWSRDLLQGLLPVVIHFF